MTLIEKIIDDEVNDRVADACKVAVANSVGTVGQQAARLRVLDDSVRAETGRPQADLTQPLFNDPGLAADIAELRRHALPRDMTDAVR